MAAIINTTASALRCAERVALLLCHVGTGRATLASSYLRVTGRGTLQPSRLWRFGVPCISAAHKRSSDRGARAFLGRPRKATCAETSPCQNFHTAYSCRTLWYDMSVQYRSSDYAHAHPLGAMGGEERIDACSIRLRWFADYRRLQYT